LKFARPGEARLATGRVHPMADRAEAGLGFGFWQFGISSEASVAEATHLDHTATIATLIVIRLESSCRVNEV